MEQRDYEAIYILPAGLDDEGVGGVVQKYARFVEEQGGTVEKAERWEKRKLAYQIGPHAEGNYCLMHFKAPPTVPAELGRLFRISDEVIRGRIYLREESK